MTARRPVNEGTPDVRQPSSQATEALWLAAMNHEDILKTRIAMGLRGMSPIEDEFRSVERRSAALVNRLLRQHELWPWLGQFPGVRGYHTARVIGYIRDPRAFAGPRSLWHYSGLHVVDGRLPRRRKGVQCDWNPMVRTACLQPGGIAEQIVRQRTDPWRGIYDKTKERITFERGVAVDFETDDPHGAPLDVSTGDVYVSESTSGGRGRQAGAGVTFATDSTCGPGLRPFQVERIARTVAVKAFVADLWRAWRDVLEQEEAA